MQRFDNSPRLGVWMKGLSEMNLTTPSLTTLELLAMLLAAILLVAGCQAVDPSNPAPAPAPTPAPAPEAAPAAVTTSDRRVPWEEPVEGRAKPFDQAVSDAAHGLLSMVELPAPGEKHLLVIDPLIDGFSGVQSLATRKIAARIAELVRKSFPQYSLQPFAREILPQSRLVLLGTLTPVNLSGQAEGKRESYRICLALVDLQSGKMLSKETARARLQSVNHMPTPYFQDSPGWMRDRALDRYVDTCEASRPGEQVQQAFLDGLAAEAAINQGIAAYDRGRYNEAIEHFSSAAGKGSADQLRIDNGLYLANSKLGRTAAATAAFSKIVEHGLAEKRLAVNFLFRPGSAGFAPDKSASHSYSMWLKEIGHQTLRRDSCLEIVGHTSRTGAESSNEKLSLDRAEYVKKKLESEAAQLAGRATARGVGSRENLVGTGKDDLSDALDRRVVFQVIPCAGLPTQTANRH
jgi:outer membrane protein OmpA-like peptidoglycan-associated protein